MHAEFSKIYITATVTKKNIILKFYKFKFPEIKKLNVVCEIWEFIDLSSFSNVLVNIKCVATLVLLNDGIE